MKFLRALFSWKRRSLTGRTAGSTTPESSLSALAGNTRSYTKRCAVCGQPVEPGTIACLECGSGAFDSPKRPAPVGSADNDLIIHMIDHQEVRSHDTRRIESAVSDSIQLYKAGTRPFRAVRFGTDAYDSDKRALWQIPEMRSWCKVLYKRVPFIFSVLDPATINWFFLCVAEISTTSDSGGMATVTVTERFAQQLNKRITENMTKLFHKLASTEEEYNQLIRDATARIRTGIISRSHWL